MGITKQRYLSILLLNRNPIKRYSESYPEVIKMSIQEIWKITQKLGTVFDMKGFTVEEVEEIYQQISRLLDVSKDKETVLRAINREGKLIDYQNRRKKHPRERGKYLSKKNVALNRIRNTIENFEGIIDYVYCSVIDVWTKDLSRTSKWRITKELEEDGIRIIESLRDLNL